MNKRILIIDDDPDIASLIQGILTADGYEVEACHQADEAEKKLKSNEYLLVFSDVHMPHKDGLQILTELKKTSKTVPPFLFVTGNADPGIVERASRLGAADVIQKPFDPDDLLAAVKRMLSRGSDAILDVMEMIRGISGITLGDEKRTLVETRILRRVRQLKLHSVEAYFEYFKKFREREVKELVSLITTHTTQFFREDGHFDYLADEVFPRLLQSGCSEIQVWSAASSSGEEAYSIAICYLEYLSQSKIEVSQAPRLRVLGTDIDFSVIEQAQRGIYPAKALERLNRSLVEKYFDIGKGELAGLVRVKDLVHSMCRFEPLNLIGSNKPDLAFDVIFLRNVLIYFKSELVKQIVGSLKDCLRPEGLLFLGHSESLNGLHLPLKVIGNSIYVHESYSPGLPESPEARPTQPRKIRVFIIDDSKTMRNMLRAVFSQQEQFEIVGEAENPTRLKKQLSPEDVDVVTLDIHMPEQDGLSYLRTIQGRPHPAVVMISSVNYEDGVDYMNCLELGAVDYIEKPSGLDLISESERIRRVVAAAARKNNRRRFGKIELASMGERIKMYYEPQAGRQDLILIGASTGGIEALKTVLTAMPPRCPPIVIVQHIPPHFSKTFADRLHQSCDISVCEVRNGQTLDSNSAYLAPGGFQLSLAYERGKLQAKVVDDSPVNRHKPSVDVLFQSAIPLTANFRIAAAILTGMGDDGARGLLALRQAGCHTIAQDEESSVVFGMPKVAFDMGAAVEVLPLSSISHHLLKSFARRIKIAS